MKDPAGLLVLALIIGAVSTFAPSLAGWERAAGLTLCSAMCALAMKMEMRR